MISTIMDLYNASARPSHDQIEAILQSMGNDGCQAWLAKNACLVSMWSDTVVVQEHYVDAFRTFLSSNQPQDYLDKWPYEQAQCIWTRRFQGKRCSDRRHRDFQALLDKVLGYMREVYDDLYTPQQQLEMKTKIRGSASELPVVDIWSNYPTAPKELATHFEHVLSKTLTSDELAKISHDRALSIWSSEHDGVKCKDETRPLFVELLARVCIDIQTIYKRVQAETEAKAEKIKQARTKKNKKKRERRKKNKHNDEETTDKQNETNLTSTKCINRAKRLTEQANAEEKRQVQKIDQTFRKTVQSNKPVKSKPVKSTKTVVDAIQSKPIKSNKPVKSKPVVVALKSKPVVVAVKSKPVVVALKSKPVVVAVKSKPVVVALKPELPPVVAVKSELPPVVAVKSELPPVVAVKPELPPVVAVKSELPPVVAVKPELPPVVAMTSELPPVVALLRHNPLLSSDFSRLESSSPSTPPLVENPLSPSPIEAPVPSTPQSGSMPPFVQQGSWQSMNQQMQRPLEWDFLWRQWNDFSCKDSDTNPQNSVNGPTPIECVTTPSYTHRCIYIHVAKKTFTECRMDNAFIYHRWAAGICNNTGCRDCMETLAHLSTAVHSWSTNMCSAKYICCCNTCWPLAAKTLIACPVVQSLTERNRTWYDNNLGCVRIRVEIDGVLPIQDFTALTRST
jgi:hypothetical protein